MRPSVGMHRHDHRIRKGARGLDRVVGVHGEMERTAGLGCARERQHHAGLEAPRNFGHAVVPDGVAADIDRAAVIIFRRQHEADDVAGQRFDAGGAVTRRGRRDRQ